MLGWKIIGVHEERVISEMFNNQEVVLLKNVKLVRGPL